VSHTAYKNASRSHEGGHFMEANTSKAGGSLAQDVSITTKPGESYAFSVWVRSPTGARISGTVALWGLGGTQESGATDFTVGSEWTLITAPLDVAKAGHTKLRAEIYMGNTKVNYDFDGASLVRGGARVAPPSLDTTPPTTTLSGRPSSWVRRTVTLRFTATDTGGSGLARTQYRLNGGAWQTGSSLTLKPSGIHTVSYRSTDAAGNTEATRTTTVRIDKTRPIAKARKNRSVKRGRKVRLYYRINDRISPRARTVRIRIYRISKVWRNGRRVTRQKRVKTITLRNRPTNRNLSYRFRCKLKRGRYYYKVSAVDLAGKVSKQTKAARKTLRVR